MLPGGFYVLLLLLLLFKKLEILIMFFNFLLSLSSPTHNIHREKGEGEKEAEGRLVTYGLWSLQRTLAGKGEPDGNPLMADAAETPASFQSVRRRGLFRAHFLGGRHLSAPDKGFLCRVKLSCQAIFQPELLFL